MKKRYQEGGPIDEMEEANKSTEGMLTNPNAKEYGESGTSYSTKATPKAARKAAPKPVAKNEDEGKRPVSSSARNILEEAKEKVRRSNAARSSMAEASRPKMEVGRLPKKGPGLSNFKSGGSASSRADGIATKGKTRGKMC